MGCGNGRWQWEVAMGGGREIMEGVKEVIGGGNDIGREVMIGGNGRWHYERW